jgi:hypothetical protein
MGGAQDSFGFSWSGPALIGGDMVGAAISRFPGEGVLSPPSLGHSATNADCGRDTLTRQNVPFFPRHPGWQYALCRLYRKTPCVSWISCSKSTLQEGQFLRVKL